MRRKVRRPPFARVGATVLAGVLLAGGVTAPAQAAGSQPEHLTDLVNPFIGTEEDGNTYPGAAVPFGMTQMSPDTGHMTGYSYKDKKIRGFSPVHISGVGCGLGGDLPTLPTIGEVDETDNTRYAAGFSHDDEKASPGYYRVGLKSGITAELSATKRTGAQRYTFPRTRKANVLLNTGQALHKTTRTSVKVLDSRTIRTTITGRGFCQDTKPYTLHTITHFDRPFASSGTWKGSTVTPGSKGSTSSGRNGAYVRFDTRKNRTVHATTALSYVDATGARRNLDAEGGKSFDATRKAARRAWERRLRDVRAAGGSNVQRHTFYSALYRSFLGPNTGNDVDGRYTGRDQHVHRATGFTYYQNFSLWDTYRTQAQLLALLAPRESRDMALSVLRTGEQGGWLPKWGYATVETNIMTGDPVTPYLTNAYQQGLLRGHEEEAYRALRRNADGVPPRDSPSVGREANRFYLKHGYVPYRKDWEHAKPGDSDYDHGGSATLEYALSDAMLGEMASDLGHHRDARRYRARAQNFRSVFDPDTGFFRARDDKGEFAGPESPAKSEGFHEGTSWQYQWMVPQNLGAVINLIGGKKAANKRLDSFFAYPELVKNPKKTARDVWVNGPYDYYNADKYNPQNEPDLIAPYAYLSTGQPWKTTDVVHAALTLFTNDPTGMTGNDDVGTMSAWMVLSAMGVFPVQPGTATWGLSSPIFDRVDLRLDRAWYPRGRLTIRADHPSAEHRYVQSARLGGAPLHETYLTTDDLRSSSRLSFSLGDSPSAWGTGPSAAPPTLGQD